MAIRKFFDGVQLLEIDDHQDAAQFPVGGFTADTSVHSLMAEPNADPAAASLDAAKTGQELADQWQREGATVRHAIPVGPPNAGVGVPSPGQPDTALNHSLTGGAADDAILDPGLGGVGGAGAATVDGGQGNDTLAGDTGSVRGIPSEFETAQAGWDNKDAIRASIKAWGGEDPHASATRAELEEAAKEAFDTKQLA